MKERDTCPSCKKGHLVVNALSSYYYCNNCYKYIDDVKKDEPEKELFNEDAPDEYYSRLLKNLDEQELGKFLDSIFGVGDD